MRNFFHSAGTGIIVGLFISIIFSYLFGDGTYYPMSPQSTSGAYFYEHVSPTSVLVLAIVCWALIGIVFFLAGYIFQKDHWSIVKMTIIHFFVTCCLLLPLSILSGWYPLRWGAMVSFIIIFIVVYAVIWITIFSLNRRDIEAINQKLKEE